MQPTGSLALELVLAGQESQERAFQTALPSNFYAGYVHLPPGTYPLTVYRAGNRTAPIKSFNVVLHNNSYLTILATEAPGGAISAELLDDTPDPAAPPTNRLTVRQFCANVRAQVSVPGPQRTDLLEMGHTQTLVGLPSGAVPISIRVTSAGGVVRTMTAEADFRTSRHASVLVFTDPYGRVRPRVSIDGPSPADEDAAVAEAASSPIPTP